MIFSLEAMFACIDTNDHEGLREYFDPDIIYHRPGYEPLVGLERVLTFYRSERVIGSGTHCVVRSAREGDILFAWGTFAGTRRNGASIPQLEFTDCYVLRNEKVVERKTFFYAPLV